MLILHGCLVFLCFDINRFTHILQDYFTGAGSNFTIALIPVKQPWGSINNTPLRWRHIGHDSVSNHQPNDCLLNNLFRRRSKKTSKLLVTGLWAGNSPGAGEFPAQMASDAENVSIWWRHHATGINKKCYYNHHEAQQTPCIFYGMYSTTQWMIIRRQKLGQTNLEYFYHWDIAFVKHTTFVLWGLIAKSIQLLLCSAQSPLNIFKIIFLGLRQWHGQWSNSEG